MNVLSLFDGISCGRVALERAGIKVDKYYSSEIDKYAIQIADKNYPDNIKLGDVCKIDCNKLSKIDLLIGGSPCQNLSSSNVYGETKGLDGIKSKLFWEYIRILKETSPTYFLLENVGSMRNSDREIIDRELGVTGVNFNSSLLSAQNRNRVYWTNINFNLPNVRKNIFMQDILEKEVDDKYYLTKKMYDCVMKPASKGWQSGKIETDLKIARPLTATMHKGHRADTDNYITGVAPIGKTNLRRLTPLECERLQTLPDNYTFGVSDTQRYMMLGNGWTVDVIAYVLKGLK
jgi:DNA-cytosine methyltransferase